MSWAWEISISIIMSKTALGPKFLVLILEMTGSGDDWFWI
jgi:hypothetical protein